MSPPSHNRRVVTLTVVVLLITGQLAGVTGGQLGVSSVLTVAAAANAETMNSCGVIDQPGRYELGANVAGNVAGGCIEITASDVTLDGRGHVLDGGDDTGLGVTVNGSSVSNVTVRNLTVERFHHGTYVEQASDVTLRNVTAQNNDGRGVVLRSVDVATVTDGEMRDNGENGLFATEASASLAVRNNTVSSNGEGGSGSAGLVVSSSSTQVSIENNTLDSNPGEGIFVAATIGVEIRNNTVSNSGGPGVQVDFGSDDATVADNVLSSNQVGVQVGSPSASGSGFISADGVTLSGNDVSDSEEEGILVLGSADVAVSANDVTNNGESNSPFGINATASNAVTVSNNTVDNNTGGIYLFKSDDGTAADNVVTGNDFGLITEDASRTTIAGNTVTGNAFDGITVIDGSDNVVRNNTATGNKYGILLAVTDSATVVDNDVSGNVNGTYLDAATNVTFRDTLATSNSRWALVAFNDSTVASATNYTLTGGASVNFSARDVTFRANATPPAIPADKATVGPVLNATNRSPDGWLNLTVGYDESTLVTGGNESSMKLWRYDGGWSEVAGTNAVDEATDTVTANVTSFSAFALLADEEPVANVTPDSRGFGEVGLTDTPPSTSVTVVNDGRSPLNVTAVSLGNETDADAFTITDGDTPVVDPGEEATVTVEFAPDRRSAESATLVVEHNASGSPSTVSLTGTGVAPDVTVTSGAPVAFGNVSVGAVEEVRIRVENNGTKPLQLDSPASILGPDATAFRFDSATGDPTPTVVQPGGTESFVVQFVPEADEPLGEKTASLAVAHNATGRPPLNLTLTGRSVDTVPVVLESATATDATGETVVERTELSDGVAVEVVNGQPSEAVRTSLTGGDDVLTFTGLTVHLADSAGDFAVAFEATGSSPPGVPEPSNADPVHYFTVEGGVADPTIDRARLSVRLSPDALPRGASMEGIVVLRYHDGEWQPLDTATSNGDLVVRTPGFSAFAVAVETPDLGVTDATIDATEASVGEAVAATVTLENDGTGAGTRTVEVVAGDEVVAATEVTVAAGERERVTLAWTPDDPGTYAVSVGNASAGTLEVVGRATETTTSGGPTTASGPTTTPDSTAGPTPGAGGDGGGLLPVIATLALLLGGLLVVSLRREVALAALVGSGEDGDTRHDETAEKEDGDRGRER